MVCSGRGLWGWLGMGVSWWVFGQWFIVCEDCFQVWGCLMRDFVGFIDSWEVVLAFSVAIIGDRSSRSRISAISRLVSASFSASASLSPCCSLLVLPLILVLLFVAWLILFHAKRGRLICRN